MKIFDDGIWLIVTFLINEEQIHDNLLIFVCRKKIDFYDIRNLERVVLSHSVGKEMLYIGNVCSVSPSMLIYVFRLFENPKNEAKVVWLDCSPWPPKVHCEITIRPFSGGAPGMCYIREGKKSALVVAQNTFGLFVYNTQTGKPYWKLEGEPKGNFSAPGVMNFTAVSADGRGHLLACDRANRCVHMVGLKGQHLGVLLNDDQILGEPWRILWWEERSSLVVAHEENNNYVSAFTVK